MSYYQRFAVDNTLIGKETIDAVLSADGAVSSSLDATGAITGRVSSTGSIGGQVSPNQNVEGGLKEPDNMELNLAPRPTISAKLTLPESRAGGTNDYEELINKPKINSVTLIKNKSFEDLGLLGLTNMELDALLQ